MRSPLLARLLALSLLLALFVPGVPSVDAQSSQGLLRQGEAGPKIVLAQHFLYQLGLLRLSPDGMFGPVTLEAVKQFQREHGLAPDGVIGPETWSRLHEAILSQTTRIHVVQPGDTLWDIARTYDVSVDLLAEINGIVRPSLIRSGRELVVQAGATPAMRPRVKVEIVHWTEASKVYANFKVITVTDVWTGKSFQARRYYGHMHADTEPLTADDADTLRAIYGGWSWERRPIIVEVDGRRIAASMNGVPHGQGAISDNGFPGHFCIHFLGSRIHRTGKIDTRHQTAVLEAAGYKVTDLWLAHN